MAEKTIYKLNNGRTNLVPRVLRLFGQQVVNRRDSGDGDYPLTKEPEPSRYDIAEGEKQSFVLQSVFTHVYSLNANLLKKKEVVT